MRPLTVLLLLASLPASAAPKKKPAPAKPAAATGGTALPVYASSTGTLTVERIAARFAETDARLQSLTASFRQSVRLEGSDAVQSVEGDVVFRKPDLLRLTHRLPEPQTVVSDGTWLWVHRRATNQVIQTRLDAWRKSEPLAQGLLDFGRSAELLSRYKTEIATVSAPGADGHRTFELTLTPKTASAAGDFILALRASTRDFFPADATLRAGRASIRSRFENVRLNPALADDVFRFEPPPDAELFKSPEPKE